MTVKDSARSRSNLLKYAAVGFVAALVLLAPFGFALFTQTPPAAFSAEEHLEEAEPIPTYMHPETKGIETGVHIGDHQGIEYWEAVDGDDSRCLLYGDPQSRYSGSSCNTDERYLSNGVGAIFIFPDSTMKAPVEAVLLPEDVESVQLGDFGYSVLEGRVAISYSAGSLDGKSLELPREQQELPAFQFKSAPAVDRSNYINE